MGVTVTKTKGQGAVSVQDKGKDALEWEYIVGEEVSPESLANVGMAVSYTKNLGNYESCKVTVSLYRPAYNTEGSVNGVFAEIKQWVDDHMNEVVSEATGAADL